MNEQIVAIIKPHSGATLIHLYLPGYVPGRKARSLDSSMCGTESAATEYTLGGRTRSTGRQRIPLTEAALMVTPRSYHRWCPSCIGRLADLDGTASAVVEEHLNRPVEAPTEGEPA